jgi:hypothetical protein
MADDHKFSAAEIEAFQRERFSSTLPRYALTPIGGFGICPQACSAGGRKLAGCGTDETGRRIL